LTSKKNKNQQLWLRKEEENLSTEQRLERYYDRRGINKEKEEDHATSIQEAVQTAKKAATSEQVLTAFQKVRPWIQVNTRLGWSSSMEESRIGPENRSDN
jgi:hypothetical protein